MKKSWRQLHPQESPDVIPRRWKQRLAVYSSGGYFFYKLPPDLEWIRREGYDMGHCLDGDGPDYLQRMKRGEIEVWSMTEEASCVPMVDIEVALTRASYDGPVLTPTVTQIRGFANQCPPKDEYLAPLMHFFDHIGRGWKLASHDVRNFDGRVDGDLVMQRVRELREKKS